MKIEARRSKPMQMQEGTDFSAAGVLKYAKVEKSATTQQVCGFCKSPPIAHE
jgi:hypothetical protein